MTEKPAAEKLVIDPTRCDGIGICAIKAPDLIELDVWGFPLLSDETLDKRLHRQAARAVAACPKRALILRHESPLG